MSTIQQHADTLGIEALCDALDVSRSTYFRCAFPKHTARAPRRSPRALSEAEQQRVLDALHSERFVDHAPAQVISTLMDEGVYLCSERSMYRLLAKHGELRERRDQARRPAYSKPELLATRPNELWSWDITKLKGPGKWSYFYLYVILDVFSRYVVGWMVALCESATLAEKLIRETCERQKITQNQLTIHADRGSSMTSKPVALLLSELGVQKTHSRPHVSDDNPYSESQFKTLKYRPDFPERFGSVEDARAHVQAFMRWYNEEHHHSGLAMLTPSDVHHGRSDGRLAERQRVLEAAYTAHPERFVKGTPRVAAPPTAAWINKPTKSNAATSSTTNASSHPESTATPSETSLCPVDRKPTTPTRAANRKESGGSTRAAAASCASEASTGCRDLARSEHAGNVACSTGDVSGDSFEPQLRV
jgi:putative transposase